MMCSRQAPAGQAHFRPSYAPLMRGASLDASRGETSREEVQDMLQYAIYGPSGTVHVRLQLSEQADGSRPLSCKRPRGDSRRNN